MFGFNHYQVIVKISFSFMLLLLKQVNTLIK